MVVERLREDLMVRERGRMARAIGTEHTCWSRDIEVAIMIAGCRPRSLSPLTQNSNANQNPGFWISNSLYEQGRK